MYQLISYTALNISLIVLFAADWSIDSNNFLKEYDIRVVQLFAFCNNYLTSKLFESKSSSNVKW